MQICVFLADYLMTILVTVLHYPFPPTAIPVDDDENQYRAALAAAKVIGISVWHILK